jgi:glycosyltransferase involved in cell wall biosynthesis
MRVLFLIRALQRGGAERQLVELVRHLDHARFSVTVVTYYAGGELANELRGLPNVQLLSADKSSRWDVVGFALRLWRIARNVRPRVVHGYMPGANELGLLLGRLLGARVIWGVRASGLDLRRYDGATWLLYRTGCWLASRADALIANSEAGRRFYVDRGYPTSRFLVIPNGIDTELYRFSDSERRRLRAQWQIGEGECLVGIVARIDPMKDHETFVRAAAALAATRPAVRFAVVGENGDGGLARLQQLARQLGVMQRIVWAGPRSDMSAVYSALDILTSSSAFGEGFSNSLAEAMACERVCVATDVGDARTVVGSSGEIIPPAQPAALVSAWSRLLDRGPAWRAARGSEARRYIIDNFSVAALAARTAEVLLRVGASAGLGAG